MHVVRHKRSPSYEGCTGLEMLPSRQWLPLLISGQLLVFTNMWMAALQLTYLIYLTEEEISNM